MCRPVFFLGAQLPKPVLCSSGSIPSCLLHSEPRSGTTLANGALYLSPFHSRLPSLSAHNKARVLVLPLCGTNWSEDREGNKVMGTGPVLMGPQSLGSERWFPGLGVVCAVQPRPIVALSHSSAAQGLGWEKRRRKKKKPTGPPNTPSWCPLPCLGPGTEAARGALPVYT